MTSEQRAKLCDYYQVSGWKKGQMESACRLSRRKDNDPTYCVTHRKWGQHDPQAVLHEIPPPDLDSPAGAWALLGALRKTEIVTSIDFGQQHILLWRYNSSKGRTELNTKTQIIDDNLSAALQQAAWGVMPEEAKT